MFQRIPQITASAAARTTTRPTPITNSINSRLTLTKSLSAKFAALIQSTLLLIVVAQQVEEPGTALQRAHVLIWFLKGLVHLQPRSILVIGFQLQFCLIDERPGIVRLVLFRLCHQSPGLGFVALTERQLDQINK